MVQERNFRCKRTLSARAVHFTRVPKILILSVSIARVEASRDQISFNVRTGICNESLNIFHPLLVLSRMKPSSIKESVSFQIYRSLCQNFSLALLKQG